MARKGTVCIIDSDRDLHGVLTAAFALEGFRVVSSSRARDAINKIELQKFTVVFIDPGRANEHFDDVFKLLRAVGAMNQKTPIVVMAAPETIVPAEALPATAAVVAKPFTLDEIVATLRSVTLGRD